MRRIEKQITDTREIETIIAGAEVCRLGLAVDNIPYVVPVFFGYENHCLYVHCAREGRKLELIKQNPTVCFEMETGIEITGRDKPPCQWSSSYRSVIGYGNAFILEDFEEIKPALDVIMRHYAGPGPFLYSQKALERIAVIKIMVTHLSGKRSP